MLGASHKRGSGWLEISWGWMFPVPAFAVASCARFCWHAALGCAALISFRFRELRD